MIEDGNIVFSSLSVMTYVFIHAPKQGYFERNVIYSYPVSNNWGRDYLSN